MAERAVARAKGFREISKKFPVAIYIARPCRCDRVEQLSGTEMHNCVQLQQIGETEFFNSVGPRWFRRKSNPKFFELSLIYERFDWIEVFQSWQES